ncbi:winged helix-turn-helix domain-containing protein [Ruegeria sp. R13_0]|uniref:winged helix-turn-helix domain-containing protein n=1 Tax=Ruegeria sp. R13_0 TaxID=2821099 RepID=UPI001ADD19A9|nr:winged helix-turn-helix domain-containing protein [Ruegeria sp. R13_0]MBO9437004.1 winged helix-turn-helix domain-containing protein [Ruegeria sp. R13_0]
MTLGIDGWVIDIAARTATRGGRVGRLSPRAVRLLQVLAKADGAVVSREDLLDRVWPNVTVSDESLTQVVSEVRRTLTSRQIIATVARGGYRLTKPALVTTHSSERVSSKEGVPLSLDAYTLFLEARQCLERGSETDLISFFDLAAEAARMAPDNAEARALNAEALFKRHLYWSQGEMLLEAALTEAEAAIRLDPTNAKAHLFDGVSRIAAGWFAAGYKAIETALFHGRNEADVHLDAAKLLYTAGNARAAASLAVRAASLAPNSFEADFLAARILMEADPHRSRVHAERALKRVRDALSVEPQSMRPLYTLAPLLAMLGDRRGAQATIEGVGHHDSPLEYNRVLALSQIGDTSSAMERLEFLAMRGWRHACVLDKEVSLRPVLDDPRFARLNPELQAV